MSRATFRLSRQAPNACAWCSTAASKADAKPGAALDDPPQPVQQLDIFADSRDVGLRNDLAQALLDGDGFTAQRVARELRAACGDGAVLASAAVLIEHLQAQQAADAPGASGSRLDAQAVLDARRHLDGPVTAAAAVVFDREAAQAWLAGRWQALAEQAAGVGWHPAQADAHAASLYLRAQAWAAAASAVDRIDSWRRIPQPLLWMTQARWRIAGADAGWPLLAEALWLAPARAVALLPLLADPALTKLAARFEACFDLAGPPGEDWAWLPAFALVERPLLASPLALASPPLGRAPGEAFKTVAALLRLERQGRHHEVVAQRARLKALSPPLMAAYMATR